MSPKEILEAIGNLSDASLGQLLQAWNDGMHDEWDIGLAAGMQEGFGEVELRIAARTGAMTIG